jgi:hypothetical protein
MARQLKTFQAQGVYGKLCSYFPQDCFWFWKCGCFVNPVIVFQIGEGSVVSQTNPVFRRFPAGAPCYGRNVCNTLDDPAYVTVDIGEWRHRVAGGTPEQNGIYLITICKFDRKLIRERRRIQQLFVVHRSSPQEVTAQRHSPKKQIICHSHYLT